MKQKTRKTSTAYSATVLGEGCGGNFKITENGVKDCSDCMVPHKRGNYDYICSRFKEIVELTKEQ